MTNEDAIKVFARVIAAGKKGRDLITDEMAIDQLHSSGWMEKHDKEVFESGVAVGRAQMSDMDKIIEWVSDEYNIKHVGKAMTSTDPAMPIKLDALGIMPTRAHEDDAGLDLYAPYPGTVKVGGSCVFDTHVHVAIPKGFCGVLVSKSGLNMRDSLTSTGLIDSGYTGSIRVKLYNHGTEDRKFERGEKISQLVIIPCITPELELVMDLEQTERGENGFGSTGK